MCRQGSQIRTSSRGTTARYRSRSDRRDRRGAADRPAAVLVPIIEREELSVLFTQRTAHLADHGGQISFPGGKIDAGDESPAAAALREAEEEIALCSPLCRADWLSRHSHDPVRLSYRARAGARAAGLCASAEP